MVSIQTIGGPDPLSSRIFFTSNGRRISPWHDIPLYADEANGILNMVVEIPKGTNAKLEVSTVSEVFLLQYWLLVKTSDLQGGRI